MRALAALALLPLLGSCGPGEQEAPSADPGAETPAARPTRDVLDATLAELGVSRREGVLSARELRGNRGLLPGELDGEPGASSPEDAPAPGASPAPGADPLDPEMIEFRDGLVGMVVSDPRYLEAATGDVAAAATELTPALAAGLRELDRPAEELKVLAQFARSAPHADTAAALAELSAAHDDPTVRAFASWALIPAAELEGSGAAVPALLRRLKYEKDTMALLWAARALAAHDNLSGLPTLTAIAGAGVEASDAANQQLYEVVRLHTGREDVTAEDADRLMADWAAGKRSRSSAAPTSLRGEVWTLISDLSGEHFQLRGVDDARFILSRLGPWAAAELGAALEDDDEYVRLHAAQVLERMGPRGGGAAPSLELALHDSSDGVAGAAAEALASVAPAAAGAPLAARLDEAPPHEVRVALIRGLGRTDAPPVALLLTAFEAESAPADLRLAAAEGLIAAQEEQACLPWLASAMTQRFGDPAGAEALVGRWLAGIDAQDPDLGHWALLRPSWEDLGPRHAIIHTADQARERRAGRAQLLADHLRALPGR